MKRLIALIILFLVVCAPLPQASAQHRSANTSRQAAAMETDILILINQYRQKKGLPALQENSVLQQMAQAHSRDMASGKVPFSHDGFDERVAGAKSGIPALRSFSENVAEGYTDAAGVVAGWLKSKGHRRNIESNATLTGIGIASSKNGRLYYTQVFAGN